MARAAADLWWLMLGLGAVVFVVVGALLFIGLGRRASDTSPRFERWIAFGVGVTVVILLGVLAATLAAMRSVAVEAPPDALEVEVVGHQWWWEVRYPESGVITANVIHIPVGEDVVFRLSSSDVIHSFWVPALGGKMDLLPDRVNTLVLKADRTGEFSGNCAEFCGVQHYQMGITVIAEDAGSFQAWIAAQRADAAPPTGELASRGLNLFLGSECAECHTIRGTEAHGDVGPDLTHLATRAEIGAGTLTNTPLNLTTWITDPHTIKDGVDMPAAELSEEEIAALVAYLDGLE